MLMTNKRPLAKIHFFAFKKYQLLVWVSLLSLTLNLYAESKNTWHFDIGASSQADSNINQAEHKDDIVEDSVYRLALAAAYEIPIGQLQAFSLNSTLSRETYKEVDTLNNTSLAVQAAFLWQNKLGYTAPLMRLSFNIREMNSDTEQRDSTFMTSMFTVSSQFTDAMSAVLGISHRNRDSKSDVYDLKNNRIFLSLDHVAGKTGTIYSTIGLSRGDIFSLSRPGAGDQDNAIDTESWLAALHNVETWQWDQAFNDHYQANTKWRAYRSAANTQTFLLGYNHGLGHNAALDISALYVDTTASAASYQRSIFNATMLKRF